MTLANNKNYFLYLILFFICLEGIFFNVENNKINNNIKREEQRPINVENSLKNTPIIAKAYSIYDISLGKKIYGMNDDVPLPLASLTKTMSMVVVLNNYKDDEEVVISKAAINQAGNFGIYANEHWNVIDLAKLTLISSANDGIYAMLENDPRHLEKMNNKAKKIGMLKTVFLNSTGLDLNASKAGATGTAEDANAMAIYGLKSRPAVFGSTVLPNITLKSKSGFIHNVANTDIILNKIPNIEFSKTGYTELAGGNLTVIFKDKMGHDIAITVLGSTFSGRFSDMEKLVNIAQLSYTI